MASNILISKDQNDLIKSLCNKIEQLSNQAIKDRSRFTIGLSGGSLIDFLAAGLPGIKTDWTKWLFILCDERIVPEHDKESTAGLYKSKLFTKIQIKPSQFLTIDSNLSPSSCADSYGTKLKQLFPDDPLPKIDLLLLGLGPDGHTCSLFPGHPALSVTNKWVVGIDDSPKMPPQRITLTYDVINNARSCIFVVAGKGKAEMIKRIVKDGEEFPAGLVKPDGGAVWMLDEEAGSLLK